ncbi:autotransporter outer membrane beta-barrel domain-containing protein [Sutterella megalosphaeroides]|uniref:Autotransporter domain-containing protein n=1 Tax=Sutterella megalosphaeroides TaxID=2494234 RepID=A0A2Z6IAN7_9BURK|nr:autotransporter outer membrane beta-barrel domain-containing protein [Sutterella megalosphaeroides]BBF23593.1 hypothetical protein SUTMEG_14840 [Sutterella megalosphaeroides]
MNRIFKTQKNRRTGALTAVSELQRSAGKKSVSICAAAVASALLAAGLVASPGALAAPGSPDEDTPWSTGNDINLSMEIDNGTTHIQGSTDFEEGDVAFAFGDSKVAAKTYVTDIYLKELFDTPKTYFHFNGEASGEVTLDLGSESDTMLSLAEQSAGFEQALVTTTGRIYNQGKHWPDYTDLRERFYLSTGNGDAGSSESNVFYQYLADGAERVGRAAYVIGEAALGLKLVSDGSAIRDRSDYINGLLWGENSVSTTVVMAGIELYDGKVLPLQAESGTPTFGAKLWGAGGIAVTGTNPTDSVLVFDTLYESDDAFVNDLFAGGNTFTGRTYLKDVAVDLKRQTSLGSGNTITAQNARVTERIDGALADNHALRVGNTTFDVLNGLTVRNADFSGQNTLQSTGTTAEGNAFSSQGLVVLGNASTLAVKGGNFTSAGGLELNGSSVLDATGENVTVTGTTTVWGEGNESIALLTTMSGLHLNPDTGYAVTGELVVTGETTLDPGSDLTATGNLTTHDLTMASARLEGEAITIGTDPGANLTGDNTIKSHSTTDFLSGLTLASDTTLQVDGILNTTEYLKLSGSAQLTTDNNIDAGRFVAASGTSVLHTEGLLHVYDRITATGEARLTAGELDAERLEASSEANLSISGDVSVDNETTLRDEARFVARGDADLGDVNLSGDSAFAVQGTTRVWGTLTIGGNAALETANVKTNDLRIGEALVFDDTTRNFFTKTSSKNASDYDVRLVKSDVTYEENIGNLLTGVGETQLDGSNLTLAYADKAYLGDAVAMTNDQGNNRLTLTAKEGVSGLDLALSGTTEDVVEVKGSGAVTLADTFKGTSADYKGWLRMTGTSLNLTTEASKLGTTTGVSVGTGGTLRYAGNTTLELNRIGWADPSDNKPNGTLDLSEFDFSALTDTTPALRVDSVTVNGAGTILLDQSAVTGLDDGSPSQQGDHIFDTLASESRRLVIETTADPNANQIHGTVGVNVVGSEEDSSTLTGYFNADGTFAGTDLNDDTGVATGKWYFTTLFEDGDLYVTHGLTELELRGLKKPEASNALELTVDGAAEQSFFAKLTGTGDLRKTGSGMLHLYNTQSVMSGTAYVEAGTLVADAGALGTAALDVAGNATFELHGGQDTANTQSVRTLDVAEGGTVALESDPNPPSLLTLKLLGGGTLAAGSTLTGTESSELELASGTLDITDLEITGSTYLGTIRVDAGTTLNLTGTDTTDDVDLSLMRGEGTILLADHAVYGSEAGFTGTIVVDDGWLTIDEKANTGTREKRASLEMTSGIVDSTGTKHIFRTIDISGGELGVGAVLPGSDATGALIATDGLTLKNMVIDVDNTAFQADVPSESLLSVDNATGATSWLVRLAEGSTATASIDADSITVNAQTGGEWTSNLLQDGEDVGDITYTSNIVRDAKGIGINYRATDLKLEGELLLAGADEQTGDTTLDLAITGYPDGGIRVTDKTVTLAKTGTYGTLSVNEGAGVIVNATQTLASGGEILGTVTTEDNAELLVTGGTLTIGAAASTKFAAALDAKDAARGAALRFEGRQGTAEGKLFEGNLAARKDARVEFSETSGNFALSSGTAAYVLKNSSNITFGPAAGKDFVADKVAVDATSTAYYDLTGPAAGSVDLSGVTGEGRVSLGYREAGGTLAASSVNEAFTGTLAYSNAELVIGTDTSVANSALTHFASQQGKLEVGAGSVLGINNLKTIGSDGTVAPVPIALAGDLTVAEGATLDFTPGIRIGNGDGYFGNASGVSVNAIDLNQHKLIHTGGTVTVKADIKDLDFASGLPGNGSFDGSILDLIGEEPDYPVLALITDVNADETELKRLAAGMKLDASNASETFTVEYWQPSWDPDATDKTVHVADVHTGAKVVADVDNKSLAIGAGITKIDILSSATLRIDASKSLVEGTHLLDAEITGGADTKVVVTNNLTPDSASVTFAADNSYTGETRIDLGAVVDVIASGAFAESSRVSIGTMTEGEEGEAIQDRSVVTLNAAAEGVLDPVRMKALDLGANGTLALADRNILALTEGNSEFAEGSAVTGSGESALVLAGGDLVLHDPKGTLEQFGGIVATASGSTIELALEGDYTWKNSVRGYGDVRQRTVGSGEFVKTGAGELTLTGAITKDLSAMNLRALEGSTRLAGNVRLGNLAAASRIVVDGVAEMQNLAAEAGNIFALDVETGKSPAADNAEETSVTWGLGENGSDGIRVTGTASGTLNLAVTPKDLDKGAEESIQLVDTASAAEGFTVNLVDATGAEVKALTAGAYDYTLVRKDDASNGTDVFLSSITGDGDVRNTTVTAGSYLGVAAAAQLFDLSLHDRMSNRSWLKANADGSIANAFWVVENVSHERYGDSTGQISVHDTASTTTLGSDVLSGLAAGGTWYAGAMFSYATEDTKSRSTRTGLESRADTDAWGAGIYAGWQLEGADRTGPYVDGWLMWTDAESDVKGLNVSETADGNGLSASLEAGWGFKAFSYDAHGQAGDIYVEPHVSVTWFGYEADDISNDVHDVTFEGKDNIRTKLGVKTYAFGKTTGGFSPYVELNWIHNTETYGVTMSNVTVEQMGAEDQAEVRAGADWRVTDSLSVWGHFGYASGSNGYSASEGTLGLRYAF